MRVPFLIDDSDGVLSAAIGKPKWQLDKSGRADEHEIAECRHRPHIGQRFTPPKFNSSPLKNGG